MPTLRVNDLEMFYRERGDGPTVVALHPATVSGAEMGWLAGFITHEGFNVVIPDQRGHGQTTNPAPDLHLPRLVDDLLEFVYLLGRTPLHGVGYSMGGVVMLYAAARRPDLFRSLVLLGMNYRAPSAARLNRVLGPPEERSDLVRQAFDPDRGILHGWDANLEAFRPIACRVLIISGDRDEFNDAEDNLALYRTLTNAEICMVPNCGHFDLVNHTVVTAAVRDFYLRVPR